MKILDDCFKEIKNYLFESRTKPVYILVGGLLFSGLTFSVAYHEVNKIRENEEIIRENLIEKRILERRNEQFEEYLKELKRLKKEMEGIII